MEPGRALWSAICRLQADSSQLAAFPAQVGALGGVLGGGDGGVVCLLRLGAAAEPAEHVGAGGVPCVVARQGQPVDEREGDFRAVQLGDRDGAVERDDRRRVEPGQLVVERDDLGPVRVPTRWGRRCGRR